MCEIREVPPEQLDPSSSAMRAWQAILDVKGGSSRHVEVQHIPHESDPQLSLLVIDNIPLQESSFLANTMELWELPSNLIHRICVDARSVTIALRVAAADAVREKLQETSEIAAKLTAILEGFLIPDIPALS